MPDLGAYAGTVLSAYGITLVLMVGLVGTTLARSRAAKARLDAAEAKR